MRAQCFRNLLIVLLLVIAHSRSATGQEDKSNIIKRLSAELQTTLDRVVAEEKLPGATVAVCLPYGDVISLASGFEDLEAKTPMPVDGQMMVGSTGKTYVSAVALQLVTEGKIGLDDLVSEYFTDSDKEWFSQLPNSSSLTVRSLMNHTSGIPRYVFAQSFLADIKQSPQKSHSPRECISVILNTKPKHEVGEGWGYSDTNYLILGLIIEKVSGNSYYDEAKRRLLDPLELQQTIPTTQAMLPGLMQGYIGKSNPFGLPPKTVENETYALNPGFEWCGGGYMASVSDLARWMHALHSGKVLDKDVYSQMINPVDFRTGKPAKQGYGLGTFVWQTDLGEFVGHAGMMPGYLTQIEYSREHKFSVAYQINTDQGSSRSNHNRVVEFARIITRQK